MSIQSTAKAAEQGGSAVAVGSGAWIWLAENQEAIAALCAIGGLAIAIAGFAVHWWYLHRQSK